MSADDALDLGQLQPGVNARSFASSVMALYVDGRLGAEHEVVIAQGAQLALMLDNFPVAKDAPKWHSEYRQVWRYLIGEDLEDAGEDSAAAKLVAELARLAPGGNS